MSGIAGIYHLDGQPVCQQVLAGMVGMLAHRGPDRSGIWNNAAVGFGHCLLNMLSPSAYEKMPLVSRDTSYVLTADARIDNRKELIGRLGIPFSTSASVSDHLLILSAYEKWGESCLDQLVGDFSFAIWDAKAHRVFCARDHVGVKPFYYTVQGSRFAFASELKALLTLPGMHRQLNEEKVGDFLAGVFEDTSNTYYKGFYRLPAGHYMTIQPEGVEVKAYWQLDPSKEISLGSDEEYAMAFREHFEEAVACRLQSDYPVGSLLSGGLDSSSITCMAREVRARDRGEPINTYSVVFDTVSECDERPFIQKVLSQEGYNSHFVVGDTLDPMLPLMDERLLSAEDEPILAPNLYLTWSIYKMAQEHGVRVILDGFDGDTTVSHGVGYFNELARSGRWLTLFSEAKWYEKVQHGSARAILGTYMGHYIRMYRLLLRVNHRLHRIVSHQENVRVSWKDRLHSAFIQEHGFVERFKALNSGRTGLPEDERHHHYRLLTRGVMAYTNEMIDRATALCGIEARFPFWDKRLVEFCLALPPEQKLHQGWSRWVLRKALDGVLPSEIQWRPGKSNLGPSFHYAIQQYEQQHLENALGRDADFIEQFVDMGVFRKTYQRFVTKTANDDDILAIWKVLSLTQWLKGTNFE